MAIIARWSIGIVALFGLLLILRAPEHGPVFMALLLAGLLLGPLLFRMASPIPPKDIAGIEAFLADRSQSLVRVQRKWFGGPWSTTSRLLPNQTGRPYRIVGREADGSLWIHIVAFDGFDSVGAPSLKHWIGGGWNPTHG